MSRESVARFVEAVNASPQLLDQCRETFKSPDAAAFVALARKQGCELTVQDAVSFFSSLPAKEPQELGEEDLAKVAGGVMRTLGDPVQMAGLKLIGSAGLSPMWAFSNPISYTPITIP